MCCTGLCKYEDHEGECTLYFPVGKAKYPLDALCQMTDEERDAEFERVEKWKERFLALSE
jgi:hypothetical protein